MDSAFDSFVMNRPTSFSVDTHICACVYVNICRDRNRKNPKKQADAVSLVPDTNWQLEVAVDTYSCSVTGNHVWGER